MSTEGGTVQSAVSELGPCTTKTHYPVSGSSKQSRFKRNNSDFFIVSSEKLKDPEKPKLSVEQRRERFSSRRPKSFKELFFKRQDKGPQTKEESKTNFANIVSKHLLPLRLVTSFRSKERPSSDCSHEYLNSNSPTNQARVRLSSPKKQTPDTTEIVPIRDSEIVTVSPKHSPTTSIPQIRNPAYCSNNNPPKVKHLALPNSPDRRNFTAVDIFTTSYTRSTSSDSRRPLKREGVCRSAQELPKSPLVLVKQKLTRSYSDTPPHQLPLKQPSSSSLNITTCLQSKMFRSEHVSQILDYLFVGSIETAYNDPQLCRLKIDSLVDMSNMSAAQVPSSKKLHCPCMCAEAERHFRSRLIIRIDDDENEDIEQYFSEINKFIDGARRCGKKVLIFSYNGKSRAPAAAIQYMMQHENFLLRQAYNLLKNQRPAVDVNPGFQETLERVERSLFPEAKPSVSFSNDYLNIADPQAIKCAWVDCTDM